MFLTSLAVVVNEIFKVQKVCGSFELWNRTKEVIAVLDYCKFQKRLQLSRWSPDLLVQVGVYVLTSCGIFLKNTNYGNIVHCYICNIITLCYINFRVKNKKLQFFLLIFVKNYFFFTKTNHNPPIWGFF